MVDDDRPLVARHTPVIRVRRYHKSSGVEVESHDVVGVFPGSVNQLEGPGTPYNPVVVGLMPVDVELSVRGRDGSRAVYDKVCGVGIGYTDVVEGDFRGLPEYAVGKELGDTHLTTSFQAFLNFISKLRV